MHRVRFDFEVDFSNGGGIQGHDFRLDIAGDDIDDRVLADHLVADLRLLMVGAVRIRNKQIIAEAHKRQATAAAGTGSRHVDLSHVIENGTATHRGLPGPIRKSSRWWIEPIAVSARMALLPAGARVP